MAYEADWEDFYVESADAEIARICGRLGAVSGSLHVAGQKGNPSWNPGANDNHGGRQAAGEMTAVLQADRYPWSMALVTGKPVVVGSLEELRADWSEAGRLPLGRVAASSMQAFCWLPFKTASNRVALGFLGFAAP